MLDVPPRRVVVEEHYEFEQEIAEDSEPAAMGRPRGVIEYEVSCQGKALRRWCERGRDDARSAVIGFLAMIDRDRTDLDRVTGLSHHHDSMPLRLPLRRGEPERPVTADGSLEYRARTEYEIDRDALEVVPVTLVAGLNDWDSLEAEQEELRERDGADARGIADAVRQHRTLRPGLALSLRATVDVDVPEGLTMTAPVARRVAVAMPHLTSLDRTSLEVVVPSDTDAPDEDDPEKDLLHRPDTGVVEWYDVAARRVTGDVQPDDQRRLERRRFTTPWMFLLVHQPGEMLETDEVRVDVEVELPGLLLSGMRLRHLDASGSAPPTSVAVTRSVVHLTARIVLRDVFARRTVQPRQRLTFDEIVPNEGRVEDVRNVLELLGFEVKKHGLPVDGDTRTARSDFDTLLRAQRSEGADTSYLDVLVEGRHAATHRRTQHGPDHQFSSRIDSGELVLHLRGKARGQAGPLVEAVKPVGVV